MQRNEAIEAQGSAVPGWCGGALIAALIAGPVVVALLYAIEELTKCCQRYLLDAVRLERYRAKHFWDFVGQLVTIWLEVVAE